MIFIDTDLAIPFLSKRKKALNALAKKVMRSLFNQEDEKVCLTIFNFAELLRGAYLSERVAHNIRIVEQFKRHFAIIMLTDESVETYAKIYAELKQKDESIGDMDELIASIVIVNDGKLYTKNIEHYNKIKMLNIVDWSSMDDLE